MTKDNNGKFNTGGGLVRLNDLSPKGPVYYYSKDILLGEGGYAKVFKGYAVVNGKKKYPVAIKSGYLNDVKEFYKDKSYGAVPSEVHILKRLPKHPSAIRFLHYEKTPATKYVIIMEAPERSKDLHRLRGERCFPFPEKKAKVIVKDLSNLLLKMQRIGIFHGDIKPRNVIYDFDKDKCKLVDFVLARYFQKGAVLSEFQGTQSFMPPEFLTTRQYDPRRETVWRLGIIAYYLMTGCRPYTDAEQALLRPYGTAPHLKHFSSDARDLVESMLSVNPNKRPSLKAVLKHPWITGRPVGLLRSFSQYLYNTKTT